MSVSDPTERRRWLRPRKVLGSLTVRIWAVRLGFAVGRLMPIRPVVVLASQRTSTLSGNLVYIEKELASRTPQIPVRVLAYRITGGSVRRRIRSLRNLYRSGYALATSRVLVVDDYFFPMYVITPRPGTIRVQTWHAAGAFKKIGYSVLDKGFGADEDLVRRVPIHSNYDVCLMPSGKATVHYIEAYRQPLERFVTELGYPRTDLFFDEAHKAQAIAAIRSRYAIPADRKVLLYAPTFRGDTVHSARYDDSLDIAVMHAALADEWVLLMRLHPFVRTELTLTEATSGFAIDVSDWSDMNELMFVADLMVTDYSSAIFEFALLQRPMAFLAPDSDAYEHERGFYFDFRSGVPGPVFETTAELAAYVKAGSFDVERASAFARESFEVADGHSTERFVDRVVLPALREEPLALTPPVLPVPESGARTDRPPAGSSPAGSSPAGAAPGA